MWHALPSYEDACPEGVDSSVESHGTQSQSHRQFKATGSVCAPYVDYPALKDDTLDILQRDCKFTGSTTICCGGKKEIYAFFTPVSAKKAKSLLLRKFLFSKDQEKVCRCTVKRLKIVFVFRYELCSTQRGTEFEKQVVSAYVDEVKGIPPPELQKLGSSISLLCEDGRMSRGNGRVKPVENIYHSNIQEQSRKLLKLHEKRLHKITFQRQRVDAIPVQAMTGVYKKIPFSFYLVGTQNKVYIPHNSHKKLRFLNSSYS